MSCIRLEHCLAVQRQLSPISGVPALHLAALAAEYAPFEAGAGYWALDSGQRIRVRFACIVSYQSPATRAKNPINKSV
jgi:hypothetical protein